MFLTLYNCRAKKTSGKPFVFFLLDSSEKKFLSLRPEFTFASHPKFYSSRKLEDQTQIASSGAIGKMNGCITQPDLAAGHSGTRWRILLLKI
jgi:hypothetical protein